MPKKKQITKPSIRPSARPKVLPRAHPIESHRYLIFTPAVYVFFRIVLQWFLSGATGGMIYGKPRYGKSSGIKCVATLLTEELKLPLPIVTVICRDHQIPSEGNFFEDFLKDLGHALYSSGKASAKRHRLTEYLTELVEKSGQDRLILFMDEAQKLHEQHYKWLIDLHNELERRGIVLIVLLVGQEELLHQFSAFQFAKKTQIIGRFMVRQLRFSGITNQKDMQACLANYDAGSEYPPESGYSFTRYYFPAAFDSDLRLENYAPMVWQAFKEMREEAQLPLTREIPMQYFCRTVEYVLTRFGTLEELPKDLSLAQWKEGIRQSGYIDAEHYVVDAEPHD
jgi:AAA domain